jgi:hypothetical protein
MGDPENDAHLIPVWVAFADQFLDTETRTWLPSAALAAVEAGLSVEQARDVWCQDVMPVVGRNLFAPLGQWSGWKETWLVESIREKRKRKRGRFARSLQQRFALFASGSSWRTVEHCMLALRAVAPEQRTTLVRDLHVLAEYYFDFTPSSFDLSAPGRKDELARVFRQVFVPAFGHLTLGGTDESRSACAERVERALGISSSASAL